MRDAILDTVATQVRAHGLLAATMSKNAEEAGIGRATLYKYFADTEAVLAAWHEREVAIHLQHLVEVWNRAGGGARAARVSTEYLRPVDPRAAA